MELFSIRIQRTFQLVSTCTEQAWGEINQNPCNNHEIIAGIFIFNFSYPKSCGHKAGFTDVNELSDSFRFGIVFR